MLGVFPWLPNVLLNTVLVDFVVGVVAMLYLELEQQCHIWNCNNGAILGVVEKDSAIIVSIVMLCS
jgi:hypothetical protein